RRQPRAEAAGLSRSLRRTDDAHPEAVFQGGRAERVTVVPANAGTHTPRPAEGAHWKTPSVQPATTVVAEYLRPRAIDGSRGMGPCVRRDDRDSGASTTTCSPVVEWSAFR